ncbi:MAG: biliverdin-producing heme oxygenase [Erythrobacter sp.]
MRSPTIHDRLRTETAALHHLVDQQAGEVDLATAPGQRAFLRMMVAALSVVEPALDRSGAKQFFPDWPSRRRLDVACEELGDMPPPSHGDPLDFASEAEIWGALYVLEGSRLGSRLLSRQAPGSRFLALSAADRTWPVFLEALKVADERIGDAAGMVRGAEKTFAAFLR